MSIRLVPLTRGPVIVLDQPVTLIGRDRDCDVQLRSPRISRRHCRVTQGKDYLVVRDLGSANGVAVNGRRVKQARLRPGDELAIAHRRFRVVRAGGAGGKPRGRRPAEPLERLIARCSRQEREAVLAATWIVACVDGKLRRKEKESLKAVRGALDVSDAVVARVEQKARAGTLKTGIPSGSAARRVMYHYVLEVAAADGNIAERERQIAEAIGRRLGLRPKEVAAKLNVLSASHDHVAAEPVPKSRDLNKLLPALRAGARARGVRSRSTSPSIGGQRATSGAQAGLASVRTALPGRGAGGAGSARARSPSANDPVARALTDLQSSDAFRCRSAARFLANREPDERRDEVAQALEPLLRAPDALTREPGVKALGTWGTKQSVPRLIAALEDESLSVRWAALETLGKLRDGRAAEAVAARLTEDRTQAGKALQAMGPVAEKAVLACVNHKDRMVQLQACKILKVIGTKQSVRGLREAVRSRRALVASAAGEALQAIATAG